MMNSDKQARQDYDYSADWQDQQREERLYKRELYSGEPAHNEQRAELWEDFEENWVEMTEFRLPPARANRMQGELDFGGEVA